MPPARWACWASASSNGRLRSRSPSLPPVAVATARRMAPAGSSCHASTSTTARRLPRAGRSAPARRRGSTPARSSELLPTPLRPYITVSRDVSRFAITRSRSALRPKNRPASASAYGLRPTYGAAWRPRGGSPGGDPIAQPRADLLDVRAEFLVEERHVAATPDRGIDLVDLAMDRPRGV